MTNCRSLFQIESPALFIIWIYTCRWILWIVFYSVSGRSYAVHTQKMLNAALESLVQKVQGGVVINFEKIGPDPPAVEVKVENGLDSNGNSKGTFMVLL